MPTIRLTSQLLHLGELLLDGRRVGYTQGVITGNREQAKLQPQSERQDIRDLKNIWLKLMHQKTTATAKYCK